MTEGEPTSSVTNIDTPHGRTTWDALTAVIQSKVLTIFLIAIVLIVAIWLLSDYISLIPIYAISSVLLSLFWYNPISQWLSRQSSYIEVWDSKTNTLTTYRVGKDAFASLNRSGLTNTVQSITGNNRIFASNFDPQERTLETAWVHSCDPWTYHRERSTLTHLTTRLNDALEDITVGEAMAQVEGRIHARKFMQSHYNDLDNIFFGNVETSPQQTPNTDQPQGDVNE